MSASVDLIFQRRSIRKFLPDSIEDEKIEMILKAGMAAPSAMNMQPWEFIVITAKEKKSQIRNALPFAKMEAPLIICVCGNSKNSRNLVFDRFWVQDCSAATENILLAVVGLGLGGVWCGVHPIGSYVKKISEILELPDHVKPLNVILIGYPAEKKEPRTQFKPERVHWQSFAGKKDREG
ncbi:MAG: nitroreductase family protein [Anaerolineaceae bacterium]|nr:nitroreductase family protein [Anaerolineaceae bacterium]